MSEQRSVLKGRAEVRQALHKANRNTQAKNATDTGSAADRSPHRSTSPPDGLSEPISSRPPFIPLESDAEVGFATRSRFRKRGHQNGEIDATRSRQATEPASYADATKSQDRASAANSLRRRRTKTTSPDMEFGSRGTSWSKARQRELRELLHGRLGESSVEEDEPEEPVLKNRSSRSSRSNSRTTSPRQRSSTFPALGFPTFKLSRPRQGQANGDSGLADHPEQVEEADDRNPDIPRSRLSRWLSPEPATPSGQSPDVTPGNGSSAEEYPEENVGQDYSVSDSSTDMEGDDTAVDPILREKAERNVYRQTE